MSANESAARAKITLPKDAIFTGLVDPDGTEVWIAAKGRQERQK